MKNSSKLLNTVITDGMFMNSNSSTESNSDDGKYRLPTADLIFSDDDDNNEEEIIVKQKNKNHSLHRKSFEELRRINNDIEYNTNSYCQSIDYFNICSSNDLRLEKTGWLNMKHWLTITSHEKIEIISKNQWKRFWIWLKDSTLQLFNDYLDTNPKFTINTIDSFCYPLTEQRQNVFSLTTHTGDTYCFQSSNQSELDHWIHCIHSNCLLKINLNSLKSNLKQLENDIIYENKILKLAELQLKLTINENTRLIILKQIQLLKINLENIYFNIFRYKCYLSSFNKNEILPDSKDLFQHISPTTKTILYNLHIVTPAAFYTCIISRQKFKSKQQIISTNRIETNQIVLFDSNPQRKIIVSINKTTTVGDLLKNVTDKLNFEINDYFLYFNSTILNGFIPNLNTKLNSLTYSTVEMCRKIIYQIILYNQLNLSGIEINHESSSTIFVSYVNKGSEGERLGIIKGDEIILINNFLIKDIDSMKLNRYLNQIPIMLTFRSSRLNQAINNKTTKENNRLSQPIININHEQQIKKIILELIQTERSYVQDINCLLKQYIEPLRHNSTVLPSDTIESFLNCIKSIHQLQCEFLENLQSNLLTENIVNSISETFIKYSKNFKIYSTYCAMHLRINRLLNLHQTNEYLKEFLRTCNPYHQHSSSFESYLIKPVQRVLKYPLFLQQMFLYSNTITKHQTIISLKKAIRMMNKISKYINNMQQLYEDFGQSFEYFIRNYKEQYNKIFEFHLPELYAYGEINWINICRFISRKNYQSLKTFCFVFRSGCFLLVREELNKKQQDFLSNSQTNKNINDCFIRFLPMRELQVELIYDDNKHHNHTWQIIQTNPKTQFKTYFRFSNKDSQIFVKTINNCILELSNSLRILSNQKYLVASRSCHDLMPDENLLLNRYSERISSVNHRRSPSPIWKRRTTSLRKRPLSMPNNKNFK